MNWRLEWGYAKLMKKIDLIHRLAALDKRGVYILSKADIGKMFPGEGAKAMEKSLQRMVAGGLCPRAPGGFSGTPPPESRNSRIIEDLAKALRPGALSYLSLEAILSEYGVISQIPMGRITVMTTGASGTHETPFGTIEFTHTKRSVADILAHTQRIEGRPLRIAHKMAAVRDLLRVGRNVNMIDREALEEDGGEVA